MISTENEQNQLLNLQYVRSCNDELLVKRARMVALLPSISLSNRFADQLYEDLLYYYQKNVRPVANASDVLRVDFGASLIRIIDLDEKNQVFTTNLWLEMQWTDSKLTWDPSQYGGLIKLHAPSDVIWTPDILLYNNADGDPHVTIANDAMVYYDGTVVWKPPAIYKSFCEINIEYFPYDMQLCALKFGGWSHDGYYLDMHQLLVPPATKIYKKTFSQEGAEYKESDYNPIGMDLSYFYESAEWDLVNLTSHRHEVTYGTCCGNSVYIDITFWFSLRRKSLFFTVNIVLPCMLIAFLTTFVFYLPKNKITFAISILVTLTVFYLVLIDILPPTSLVIPLMGKYLLFTMNLVACSILITVVTLNFNLRTGATHTMPDWMRWLFLQKLTSLLCISPQTAAEADDESSLMADPISTAAAARKLSNFNQRRPSPYFLNVKDQTDTASRLSTLAELRGMHPDIIRRMIDNVSFIAEHFGAEEDENQITDDWSMVAMVIDRLFLIIFSIVNLGTTILIIVQAPALFDNQPALSPHDRTRPLGGDTFNPPPYLPIFNPN